MTSKAYIVANKQQEYDILNKLEKLVLFGMMSENQLNISHLIVLLLDSHMSYTAMMMEP